MLNGVALLSEAGPLPSEAGTLPCEVGPLLTNAGPLPSEVRPLLATRAAVEFAMCDVPQNPGLSEGTK